MPFGFGGPPGCTYLIIKMTNSSNKKMRPSMTSLKFKKMPLNNKSKPSINNSAKSTAGVRMLMHIKYKHFYSALNSNLGLLDTF